MPVKRWCQEQGVTTTTYYRWERTLLSLASRGKGDESQTVAFAELPAPKRELRNETERCATVRVGDGSIDIYQEMTPDLMKLLVEALRSC